ncbi:hypothetical protein HX890_15715 [Pseudomonas gingeri]|uniref:hypothetical protein n=1 Tax=Pseudomonas gingeri TaxID=117681 RepID=UPI0015A15590|nr:hypothetical protein [Pseudomonas gingeri]NWD75562.1 hypothetical protein [Pseudomonas gingeri]
MKGLSNNVNELFDSVIYLDAEDGTPIVPNDHKIQYIFAGLTCLPDENIVINDIGYLIARRSYTFQDGRGQYQVRLIKSTSKNREYAQQLEKFNHIKNTAHTLIADAPNFNIPESHDTAARAPNLLMQFVSTDVRYPRFLEPGDTASFLIYEPLGPLRLELVIYGDFTATNYRITYIVTPANSLSSENKKPPSL